MKTRLLLLIFILSSFTSLAENHYSDLMEQGNIAYKEGNYDQALELYKKITDANLQSAQLYYNIGNTYYKTSQVPAAILYYEKALKLAPSDKDVLHNLSMANQLTVDKIEKLPVFFISEWLTQMGNTLSLNLWTMLFIICIFVSFSLLMIFIISKVETLKKASFFGFSFGIVFALLSFSFANIQKNRLVRENYAIVFSPTVTIKSSPAMNSTDLFVIHEGVKVEITESIDDWSKITLDDGNSGWILSTSLVPI